MSLLDGCDAKEQGSLRVVARTADVPFVTAFVADSVGEARRANILAALKAVGDDPKLCSALETQIGFVEIAVEKKKTR